MSYILNIETATKNCSVALGKDEQVIDLIEYTGEGYSHAEKLHVFIKDILSNNHILLDQLNAIAVSKGPGSYTGLRIGISAAKGLAYALDIPLITVSTLESMAHQITTDNAYIIPLIDARRMEVYSAVFDEKYRLVRKVQADLLEEQPFEVYLNEKKVIFLGDAVVKTQNIIQHPNALFFLKKLPSAQQLNALAYQKFLKKEFDDVAYFEPYYLKDFIVTRKKSPL